MSGIKRGIFLGLPVLLLVALFSLAGWAVEIEIQPVLEGKGYYIMKLGEEQTFTACGFGWDGQREERIPDIEISAIQWSYDERFLELVEMGEERETITLRAIRKRTSKLTVTGRIDGEHVSRTIFVVVK